MDGRGKILAWRAVRFLAVLLVAVAGTIWLRQPAMVFYPSAELVATPAEWGLAYEEVKLTTSDGVSLNGWYLPQPGSKRTLLFFHGNAGNISHRGDSLRIFHRLGLNVLIIDYRGYGKSEGSPSEEGFYRDAEAAWRYLTEVRKVPAEKIVLFGRSLGGAVAARLAEKKEPAGLILESTFTSAAEMARTVFPVLSRLTLLRYEFDSLQALPSIHAPVLVIHSPDDEIIPYALGEKLYQAADKPKRFLRLKGDHNGGFLQSQPAYEQALHDFLAEAVFPEMGK